MDTTDTLKNMEALAAIVLLKAYKMPNARFATLTRYKAISIHVIKRTLTLSVLYMADDKKFVFEELRTAPLPLGYQERHSWYEMLELLACFQDLLEEQDMVDNDLRAEHSDPMIEEDETTRV